MDYAYQKALERIKKCKENKTKHLDLGDLGLLKIPKEISELDWLEELNLGKQYEWDEKEGIWKNKESRNYYYSNYIQELPNEIAQLSQLRVLFLDQNPLKDLGKLVLLEELRILSLNGIGIRKADFISNLTKLWKLDLSNNLLRSIPELNSHKELKELNLSFNYISRIENLGQLVQLDSLALSSNQISKIENLTTLIHLKNLDLSSNQIVKIENLETLTNIKELNLSVNQISKIEKIKYLKQLKKLNLSANRISEIENIKYLKGLEELDLSANQITKIKNLESQKKLHSLNISSNKVQKLENLEPLQKLTSLYLSSNRISKIENLTPLLELNSLTLSSNQIYKIENLAPLKQLNLLYLSSNQIIEIENLEPLKKLHLLYLSSNQISKIENLEPLNELKSLNISANRISKIENLDPLNQLKELDFSSNKITKVENLDSLNQLDLLNLSSNRISKIENLDSLQNLDSLYLSSNQILKIENLEPLKQLKKLDLSSNQIVKIENLEPLRQLNSIFLHSNKISKIENLKTLNQLYLLNLSSNQITRIENIKLPNQLKELDLSTNKISKIENLSNQKQLISLNISSNNISKIENLSLLKRLNSLNLSYNQIFKIENIEALTQLKELDLSTNQISKMENLNSLGKLICLSLFYNQIESLEPKGIAKLPLVCLGLDSNPIQNVPHEILKGKFNSKFGYFNDCLEDVNSWFEALNKSSRQNLETKLFFCGSRQTGKSSLVNLLINEPFEEGKLSNPSIRTMKWNPQDFEGSFIIWDLGGQEIFHCTHRLFLKASGLYILIWDQETESKEEIKDEESGEVIDNHHLPYWMSILQSLGDHCQILVIQNKVDDGNPDFEKITFLVKEFGIKHFESTSVKTKRGTISFKEKIYTLAKELPDFKRSIPLSWWEVREEIISIATGEEEILLMTKYEKICEQKNLSTNSAQALLRFLHRTGILFYEPQFFGDSIIVLNQHRALSAIYRVFEKKSEFYELLSDRYGVFKRKHLYKEWGNRFSETEKELFLSFMERAGICFKINEIKEEEFLIPRFLPSHPEKDIESSWHDRSIPCKYLKIQHHSLNSYFIYQFIVNARKKASVNQIWSQGIIIHHDLSVALITFHQKEKYILIRSRGSNASSLITAIRNEFTKIYKHATNFIYYVSNNGEEFVDLEEIEKEKRLRNKNVQSTPSNIALSIEQFSWTQNFSKEIFLGKLPTITHNHNTLSLFHMFISYAKEDAEWLSKLSLEFGAWEHKKELKIWHDQKFSHQTGWDPEIKQKLQKSNIILQLVSKNYLAASKSYIWKEEIPLIEEKYYRKESLVFPIILEPCNWDALSELADKPALPQKGIPLSTLDETQLSEKLTEVSNTIMAAAKKWKKANQ